jgi:hypothetical protein
VHEVELKEVASEVVLQEVAPEVELEENVKEDTLSERLAKYELCIYFLLLTHAPQILFPLPPSYPDEVNLYQIQLGAVLYATDTQS